MRISKTGPGRKGTLDQGVGRLELKSDAAHEAVKLGVLADEMEDNLGFWTPIMWACRNKRTTRAERKMLVKIIDRVRDEFVALCKEPGS